MKSNVNPILVGLVAGLVAAVFMVVSAYVPILIFVAPFVGLTIISVTSLGFGNVAGMAAIAVSFIVLCLFTSSVEVGLLFALPLLPALAMSYAANLARPAPEIGGPDHSVAWYPLSDILLIAAICSGALMMLIFLVVAPDMDVSSSVELASQTMQRMQPGLVITPEMKASMVVFTKKFAPPIYAGLYLLLLFACFYFAMRILAALKLNTRPREDIRSSLRMNRMAIAIFLGGIVLAFANPPLSTIGSIFVGATAAGFMLAGYALIHEAVRNKRWALPALLALYFVTFFFLPVLAFIVCIAGGLANPRRAIALTPNNPDQTPTNQP